MRIPLIGRSLAAGLAALLLSAPVLAQDKPKGLPKLTDQQAAAIELAAHGWAKSKAKAKKIDADFRRNVEKEYKDSGPALEEGLKKVWQLCEEIEAKEAKRHEGLLKVIDEAVEEKKLGIKEAMREKIVLRKIHNLRRYMLYANLFPRIIDEWIKDESGSYIGRRYAGPAWSLDVDWKQGQATHWRYYGQLSYFGPDDLNREIELKGPAKR